MRLEFIGSTATTPQTHNEDVWILIVFSRKHNCVFLSSPLPHPLLLLPPSSLCKKTNSCGDPRKSPGNWTEEWQARRRKGGACHRVANRSLSWVWTESPLNELAAPCALPSPGLLIQAGKVHTEEFRRSWGALGNLLEMSDSPFGGIQSTPNCLHQCWRQWGDGPRPRGGFPVATVWSSAALSKASPSLLTADSQACSDQPAIHTRPLPGAKRGFSAQGGEDEGTGSSPKMPAISQGHGVGAEPR